MSEWVPPLMELLQAITRGDLERVRTVLGEAPSLAGTRNVDGISPVLWALYHQQPEIVAALLEHQPPLDAFDAAAVGDLAAVEKNVAADPTCLARWSPDGWTMLHLAAYFARPEVVHFLLAHGADPNAVTNNGMDNRPLHAAIAGQSSQIVAALLAKGAQPNVQQTGGFTPLHAAARQGAEPLVQQLLAAGASKNEVDDAGKTAADHAQEKGHAQLALLLADTALSPGV